MNVADTCTVGGTIGGNWETGSSGIDTAPASVTRIAITAAKIGRSMKNATSPGGCAPEAPAFCEGGSGCMRRVSAFGQRGRASRPPEGTKGRWSVA